MQYIHTDNKGKLEIIEPFQLTRGVQYEGVKMGQAKNKKGKIFEIYPADCGIGKSCFCWATAKPYKIN